MDNRTTILTSPLDNTSEVSNGTTIYLSSPIGPEYFAAYNVYLYLMIVLGLLCNILVIVVFFYHRPSHTTDWYILATTICDFLSSFLNVPVYATFTNGYWQFYGTTLLCKLHMFLSQSIVLSSSLLICGLALDRYLKICRKLSSYTTASARNACLIIAAVTTVMSTPTFALYENQAGKCDPIVMNATLFAYYLFVFMIFITATVIVVFSYYNVTKAVSNTEANMSRHTTRREGDGGNKVPSIHPSVSAETKLEASCEEISNSGNINIERKKGHLEMSSTKHTHTTSQEPIPSISSQFTDRVTTRKQLHLSLYSRERKSARVTKISFLVCSVFILSWIPPWLCFVLASIPGMKANVSVLKFMLFGKMAYLINGVLNPVIYTWMNRAFRKRVLQIFCRRNMQNIWSSVE